MTSNDVSQLPPELTRTGRLDARWYFSLPTEDERKEIFRIHLDKTQKSYSKDLLEEAAKESRNYSGAEIKEIVKISMRKAYKRYKLDGNNSITNEDLLPAIKDIIPIYQSSKEQIAYLEDWAKGRAQYAGKRLDKDGFSISEEDSLYDNILLSLDR